MPGQLATLIRQKYPGQYDDLDDAALEKAVLAKYPDYADLAQPEKKAPEDPNAPKPETRQFQGDRPIGPGNATRATLRMWKDNPGSVGALLAGSAAAPVTGGLSLLPAMAAEGGAAFGGALAGHGVKKAATGEGSMGEAATDALTQGALGMLGTGAVMGAKPLARLVGKAPSAALTVAEFVPGLRTAARLVRLAQKFGGPAADAAASTANTGGKLVKPGAQPSVEQAMADAIAEVRGAAPPIKASTLPPQPQLPPGYTPRATVPKPKPEPKPKPPSAAAPKAAQELPASWRQFAQEPPSAAASGPIDIGESLSPYEREAVQRELSARGLMPKYSAADVERYLKEYGQVIPPGTKQMRQGRHIEDALMEQRYRFHLDNPKSALAAPIGGSFAAALLQRLMGGGSQED